ncbi:hypothetical protein [Asticcacaulis sp. YBE204]|nr:hypothetical protein [Asticcacaulis sp. YBE204]
MSCDPHKVKHDVQIYFGAFSMLAIAIMLGFLGVVALINFIDFGRID